VSVLCLPALSTLVLDVSVRQHKRTGEMPAERPRPHELMVAHDERHSYMQRMHTLAGPGAYSVPSTFQRPAPNLLLRVVQRESYGRDFAR
jgi:hypothetical protein